MIYHSHILSLSYSIVNNYNPNYINNTIELIITYNGNTFYAKTDFNFIK
jgi:hypothetical protein